MSISAPAVVVETRGAASWARIARPERGNACGSEVMEGLEHWLDAVAADPTLRVLVLTGTGSSFCAGADMKEGASLLGDVAAMEAYIGRGRDLVDRFASAPLPTIAAVNGSAFAGGFELVLAADFAIAARSATLGDRHLTHGVVPGWGSTARLPRIIGRRAATRLLLTGETLAADEMRALGVLTAVVDDDQLEGAVADLVERLPSGPAATRVLELSRRSLELPFDEALAAEWAAVVAHLSDPAL
jgi:enoyl-CoA hydratase/carnithine racemase